MTPEQAEAGIISLFAAIYPPTVDEIVNMDGAQGFGRARGIFLKAMVDGWKREYEKLPDRSLATYVHWLTSIVTAGTRWEIVEQTSSSIRFRFTACPWATHFRAIGRPDVGRFFCDADYPMVECFSNSLGFERTRTLMDGDPCCNHHFFTK